MVDSIAGGAGTGATDAIQAADHRRAHTAYAGAGRKGPAVACCTGSAGDCVGVWRVASNASSDLGGTRNTSTSLPAVIGANEVAAITVNLLETESEFRWVVCTTG